MTSFIIVSKDKKARIAYAKDFCAQEKIAQVDITIIEKDTTAKQTTNSIGIEEVKNMQKKIFLKPIKSLKKAVIVEDAHLLTPEAQNALLKMLEEPPAHTLIMLGTESIDALLPTILSRCQIKRLAAENIAITEEAQEELESFITVLSQLSIGDRLKKAETLAKDKDEALLWIENVIIVLRKQLLDQESQDNRDAEKTIKTLRAFQKLHTILKTTNVNPRFAIEVTLLSNV
jgi:DNA polymerase III delta prime subunit